MGDVDEIHLAAFLLATLHHRVHADVVLGEHAGHRGQHAGAVGHLEADVVLRLEVVHRHDGKLVGAGAAHQRPVT